MVWAPLGGLNICAVNFLRGLAGVTVRAFTLKAVLNGAAVFNVGEAEIDAPLAVDDVSRAAR